MPSALQSELANQFGTPLYNNGQLGTPRNKLKSSKHFNLQTQPLRIGHQRINIDVDLDEKKIEGFTEITILPLTNLLRVIKLDCREIRIKQIYINGSPHTNYIYKDILYINDDTYFEQGIENKTINIFDLYSKDIGIHQHHLIRQKLNYIFGEVNMDPNEPNKELNSNTEELTIILPENLKLELTDLSTIQSPTSNAPATMTPIHARTRNTFNDVYTPIQIKIEYETINPRNGVNFVTDKNIEKKSWVAYTTNADYGVSTSSWVPCIDNFWDRCTWSLEVNVPMTARDISNPRLVGSKDSQGATETTDDITDDNKRSNDEDEVDDEDDEEQYDLVVCSGDFNNVKETPHPEDLSKKVVSWAIFNPVCAQHVGWAIGCFQSIEILSSSSSTEFDEDDFEDSDELGKATTICPVTVYCLPDQEELARNSCIFSGKAIDFFLKQFGSFPFSSYAMVFVPSCVVKTNNFAGLAVISDKLLYPPDLIESMFDSSRIFVEAISTQWVGINIVPYTFNDMWTVIGISIFMANQFLRTLMGSNEYRFRMKKAVDQIISEDIGKKPLALQNFRFPICETDLEFLRLKAPIVLYILDRRMTKTDKSFGLSRVLPKLFLQAMSGELPNGTLSTTHLQYVCEKVNRNKLDNFFKQWVYGAGVPIFSITQKFNKKKMAIEMHIRQVQVQETKLLRPNVENFIDDSISYLDDEVSYGTQAVFTGPMTIRVHEQDGTPYEHIVDLKDGNTRIDIQYNSKFRRRRKEENSEPLTIFSGLGDVLTDPAEIEDWHLATWVRTEEEILTDGFEWIRVDADFEWIAKFKIDQQDHMYASQLQHDRDVEAQFEAVKYFGTCEKPTYLECTILTRTIMDSKYFYGVRIGAAESLAKFSNSSNNFLGVEYLIRIFKELYCFPKSSIPKSNDFNDFGDYFLHKLIPRILSKVRDEEGEVPFMIKNLLLNLIKYNDNSNNDFQDCFYLSELLESITSCAIKEGITVAKDPLAMMNQLNQLSEKNKKFINDLNNEIDRLLKLDEWMPSHQNMLLVTCIRQKVKLASYGLIKLKLEDLMYYTLEKYPENVRIEGFRSLFVMGAIKNHNILEYFLKTILLSNCASLLRSGLISVFVESICIAAIDGVPSSLDDPEFQTYEKLLESNTKVASNLTNMVIIEDNAINEEDSRRDVYARATLHGAIELLRRDYAIGKGLKAVFWELLHSSMLSINERKSIFTICQILYTEIDQFIVKLPIPSVSIAELKKKIVLRDLGDGKVLIKRDGRFKIQFNSRKIQSAIPVSSRNRDQRAASKAQEAVTEPKITLNLTPRLPERRRTAMKAPKSFKAPAAPVKPQSRKPSFAAPPVKLSLVTTDPNLKSKVTFKLKNTFLSTLPDFGPKTHKIGRSSVIINEGSILFNFKGVYRSRYRDAVQSRNIPVEKKSVVKTEITKNPNHKPLRYVKILTREKKVLLSGEPFDSEKLVNEAKSEEKIENSSEAITKSQPGRTELTRRASIQGRRMSQERASKPVVYAESDLEDIPLETPSKSNSPDPSYSEKAKAKPSITLKLTKNNDKPSKVTKVKKKKLKTRPKIYIHSGQSSGKSESPEMDNDKKNSVKLEPEKSTKLKLKLTTRK